MGRFINRLLFAAASIIFAAIIIFLIVTFISDNKDSLKEEEETEAVSVGISETEEDASEEADTQAPLDVPEEPDSVPEEAVTEDDTEYIYINPSQADSVLYTANITEPNIFSAEDAEITYLYGSLTYEKQSDTYEFTAKNDGNYTFEISGMDSSSAVIMQIYDEGGNMLAERNYCKNGQGLTVENIPKESIFKVRIIQKKGFCNYALATGHQKAVTEISAYTEIRDSIEFSKQKNTYSFTVPRDGNYSFTLADMSEGVYANMYLVNSEGREVKTKTYASDGDGFTAESLFVEEIYTLHITQCAKLGNYTLKLGQPKENADITGYNEIIDSVEYEKQVNEYIFTAPLDGTYNFRLSDSTETAAIEIRVLDENRREVVSNTLKNGDILTADELFAEKQYTVQVKQKKGLGEYTLCVTTPKDKTEITAPSKISDTLTCTDEINEYFLTVFTEKEITVSLSGLKMNTAVKIEVFSSEGKLAVFDKYAKNGTVLTLPTNTIGTVYKICVQQKTGFTPFVLTVK